MNKDTLKNMDHKDTPNRNGAQDSSLIDHLDQLLKNEQEAYHSRIAMDEAEIDRALSIVNTKIDSQEQKTALTIHPISKKNKQPFFYYLAAAICLLAIGASWMFSPVSYQAPFGEKLSFQLPDGSQIQLNSGSELRHNRFFGLTHRNLSMNGEIFFEVEKSATPFVVNTIRGNIQVTGTSFNVKAWDSEKDDLTVSVMTGSVLLTNKTNTSSVSLEAGQTGKLLAKDNSISEPSIFIPDRILAWRMNNLSFYNEPLSQIFKELERTFNVRITFNESEIGSTNLTTYYRTPDNIEQILNDISTVKGLTFTRTANGYHITSNN